MKHTAFLYLFSTRIVKDLLKNIRFLNPLTRIMPLGANELEKELSIRDGDLRLIIKESIFLTKRLDFFISIQGPESIQ